LRRHGGPGDIGAPGSCHVRARRAIRTRSGAMTSCVQVMHATRHFLPSSPPGWVHLRGLRVLDHATSGATMSRTAHLPPWRWARPRTC